MNDWDKNEINDAVNRLSMQLTHEKMQDRKHLLKIEIAKATDRRVRAELQNMLADLERKERRYNIAIAVATIIILIICGIVAFNVYNNKPSGAAASSVISSSQQSSTITSSESTEQSDTITSTSSQQSVKSDVVDTKNLTSDQLKQWISAVLNAGGVTKNFAVDVETGNDGYAHGVANFTDVQTDPIGNFRVNSNGQLEEAGLYYGKPGEWIVVSPSFMDTTHIPARESVESSSSTTEEISSQSQSEGIPDFNTAVDYLKQHKNSWSYAIKNADNIEIISINVNHPELSSDNLGDFYSIVINTDDDDGSITGGGKQFRVYTNGLIQQRAGMHDYYDIFKP